ncbi:Rieske (2Fe-2S) protein [Actinosynnema sp. NPDC053489]|uniref:Rieske (2Fe-2S) protein n=1 Tax=Actinosynnema sp. NPDC053489 TaxID=3363916 RepID=UPI0037C887AE
MENTGLSRRSMLCGVLVALAVPGGLAACGSQSGPSGSGTTGTAPAGGTTPAGPPIIAALADVPDGGGLIAGNPADSKPLVIVRTGETVKAYDAGCPHQGTAVSPPQNGVITCPNHGSTFNAADGAVTKGPATKGLTEVPVKVEAGQIVPA